MFKHIRPSLTSMIAPTVARNSLPKMRGSFGSFWYFNTTKSVGTWQSLILIGTSSSTPSGTLTDLSARTKVISVGLNSSYPRDIAIECGMRFTLDLRSQRDRGKLLSRMLQSRTKRPESDLLIRILPWIIALTSSETIMTLCSATGKLLDTISFTYFFIEDDTFMASFSGISDVILSNAFLQIALSNSRLVCVLLGGKGGKVLYTISTAGLAGIECRSTLFSFCRSIFTVVGQPTLFPSCRSIFTVVGWSTLLPSCRSIFTVVGWSTLFPSCRSISTSSSNSSSSSSRSIAASSVLDRPFSWEVSNSELGLSRTIGSDLLSPVFSPSAGFSAWSISILLRMRRFPLLSYTTLTWHFGFASVRPGRRPASLLMAVAFSVSWPSNLLMCSLKASNFLISSL